MKHSDAAYWIVQALKMAERRIGEEIAVGYTDEKFSDFNFLHNKLIPDAERLEDALIWLEQKDYIKEEI